MSAFASTDGRVSTEQAPFSVLEHVMLRALHQLVGLSPDVPRPRVFDAVLGPPIHKRSKLSELPVHERRIEGQRIPSVPIRSKVDDAQHERLLLLEAHTLPPDVAEVEADHTEAEDVLVPAGEELHELDLPLSLRDVRASEQQRGQHHRCRAVGKLDEFALAECISRDEVGHGM